MLTPADVDANVDESWPISGGHCSLLAAT